MNRKTTPKVKNGRVQKKNRHTITPNYWNTHQDFLQIDIEPPGKGFKHFLKKRNIIAFLEILPNWEEIDIELNAIVLASGDYYCDGWYHKGVIGICAWDKTMNICFQKKHFIDHKELFDRLNIEIEKKKECVVCHFNEDQIIAYQLLHILLHEMGHHHDRINTKLKKCSPNGEKYAENYAYKYEKIIWNKYFELFNI